MSQVIETKRPIYVRSTGGGSGGIATLVVDGEDVNAFVRPLFKSKRKLEETVTGDLLYGHLVDAFGKVVDEVVLAPLGRKQTSTGNEQIEISCHGGEGALAAVQALLREAGVAAGSATQLLERAHLNGKLSLIALEARLRLARAVTSRQAEWLLGHSAIQQKWERQGFNLAMGMRQKDESWRSAMRDAAREELASVSASRRLLQQHHVAIIGPVNAGKSTLANALARAQRHIISEIPGTTLDRLDTPVSLRGLNVLLTDTAGLREASDPVEREGQSRGWSAAGEASLRLVVLDGSRAATEAEIKLLMRSKELGDLLIVLNKQDLGIDDNASGLGFLVGKDVCSVSAHTGSGLDELSLKIEALLLAGDGPKAGTPFTRRQQSILKNILENLESGGASDDLLPLVRKLVGTRPDTEELSAVLAENE